MSLNLKMPCNHDRHEFHYWPHIMSGFDRPVGEPCDRPEGECDPHHRYCRQTRVLTDAEALDLLGVREIDVVFDGAPGHTPGRFVETETPDGKGIGGVGRWIDRGDGTWALRVTAAVAADEEEGEG